MHLKAILHNQKELFCITNALFTINDDYEPLSWCILHIYNPDRFYACCQGSMLLMAYSLPLSGSNWRLSEMTDNLLYSSRCFTLISSSAFIAHIVAANARKKLNMRNAVETIHYSVRTTIINQIGSGNTVLQYMKYQGTHPCFIREPSKTSNLQYHSLHKFAYSSNLEPVDYKAAAIFPHQEQHSHIFGVCLH